MNTYTIVDLDGFINNIRDGAAESIAENYTENLDNFITINQIRCLIINKSLGQDEDNNYVITEDIFDTVFEEIRSIIYQVGLAKLASQGIIECAWDDEQNQMIFWMNSPKHGKINMSSEPSYNDDQS